MSEKTIEERLAAIEEKQEALLYIVKRILAAHGVDVDQVLEQTIGVNKDE